MKKRIITFAMTLALLLSLVPVIQPQAEAAGKLTSVTVSDGINLKNYLEDGGYYVTLGKDIDFTCYDLKCFCIITGTCVLNLNGHDLIIHNEDITTAAMFRIKAGAQLVVCDAKGGGSIQFRADINSDGDLKYRDIFEVYGSLTVNGGTIEAGRCVHSYSAYYAKNVYRETCGTAITVMDGGKAIINGGTFYGRGYHASTMEVRKGGTLLINSGTFYGKGGAYCVDNNSGSVSVKAGSFSCSSYDAYRSYGKTTQGYPIGGSGIDNSFLDFSCVTAAGNGSTAASSDELRITPKSSQPKHTLDCSGIVESSTQMKLSADNPVVISKYNENTCYWRTLDPALQSVFSYITDDHFITYTWMLGKNGTAIDTVTVDKQSASTGAFHNSINVMKDFSVTPQKGEPYQIVCCAIEKLGDYEVLSFSNATYFTVVDDLSAPTITKQPPASLSFEQGKDFTLTIEAQGTNLDYTWEISRDNGATWKTAFPHSKNPTVAGNFTSTIQYRCKVSNSAGTVISNPCTVCQKDAAINVDRVDIIANWNQDHSAIASYSTTTPGCTVTNVQYAMYGKTLDTVDPGFEIEMAFSVVPDEGYKFSSDCKAVLNGSAESDFRITGSPVQFVFSMTVPYPEGGLPIGDVNVNVNDPVIGQPLGKVTTGYIGSSAAKSRVDRLNVVESFQWLRNGQPVSADTAAQEGAAYTVQITLKSANENYHYTANTAVSMNGNSPNVLAIRDNGLRMDLEIAFPPLESDDPGTGDDYVFPFVDVLESDWFYSWVKNAHQMGLVEGTSATTFSPSGNMSYAQAITLAARMHQKYTTGAVTLVNGTDKWYDTYVQYCWDNGIIDTDYSAMMNAPIDRQSYAYIFSMALPKEALKEKNTIPNGSIPDVQASNPNYTAIYQLYRAGILNGSDAKGTFNPTNFIKRSEVSAIVVRMMDESVRVGAPAELGM